MSFFDSLESRRLLAASAVTSPLVNALVVEADVSVKLSKTGTLQVNGSSGKDRIELTRDEKTGAVIVKIPSAASVSQGSYGVLKTGGYDASLVKRIKVDAGGGGDVVNYLVRGKFAPAVINGGKGDDRITTLGRKSILLGGSGDDTLISKQTTFLFYSTASGTNIAQNYFATPVTIHPLSPATIGAIRFDAIGDRTLSPSGNAFRYTIRPGETAWSQREFTLDNFSVGGFAGRAMNNLDATGNRLDGGDGDDTFETYGTEDTIVGGSGTDSYTAPANGVDVYQEANLTPIAASKDVLTVRSRLAAFGVEQITTKPAGNPGAVTVNGGSLAELA